jgi:hypothetical protein
MSTVAQLIDRVYREYLYPPREQPARTTLDTTVDNATLTIVYTDAILSVEEENSLGQGVTIELERELIPIASVDTGTQTITALSRGYLGTAPAAHTDGVDLRIAPDYPRQVVFDALADALEALYPDLFIVKTVDSVVSADWEVAPANVGEVIGANYSRNGKWRACGVKVLKGFPDSGTERAFMFADGPAGARAYVRYKAQPTRIELEADDLGDSFEDYYIQTRWEPIAILETVALMMGTIPVDAATQEFITESLAAQGFEPEEGESVRDGLLRFANFKRAEAKTVLMREYPLRMTRNGYAYGDA